MAGQDSDLDQEDSNSYEEAILDINFVKWQEAMKAEMDSMYANKVWTLIDGPKGIVLVGNKWIYKRKRVGDERVETFKARLVEKTLSLDSKN